MRHILLAALASLAAAPALASPQDPPRKTDVEIASEQSLVDLQSCITRVLSSRGRVTPVLIDGGVSVDFHFGGGVLNQNAGEAKVMITIMDAGEQRMIGANYRRPMSAKAATNFLRDTGKRCFREEAASAGLLS